MFNLEAVACVFVVSCVGDLSGCVSLCLGLMRVCACCACVYCAFALCLHCVWRSLFVELVAFVVCLCLFVLDR